MNKNLLTALVLIVVCVLVLISNTSGHVKVDLLFTSLSAARAMVFLGFIAIGVIIGILLK